MSEKIDVGENMKFSLQSADVQLGKRDVLRNFLAQNFPECVIEGDIDVEQLKRVLGHWAEPGHERFGLVWPGKAQCMRIIQQPSNATLKPDRSESLDFDKTQNVFVEGDQVPVQVQGGGNRRNDLLFEL